MAQFDVYVNPSPRSRGKYPFVVLMQAEWTADGAEQIIAPLARRIDFAAAGRRLAPVVEIGGLEYAAIVPALAVVHSRELKSMVGSIASQRQHLLAAIDYLFFGL
jgi:toxin CcdB